MANLINGETVEFSPEEELAEDSAFEAAFNDSDIMPVSETDVTPKEDPQQQEPKQGDAPETAQEPTVREVIAMLDAERAENQKLRDKVFGKVGELGQKIEAMRSMSTGLSPKAKERLMSEFPELADMLFDSDPVPQQVPQQQYSQPPVTTPSVNYQEEIARAVEPVKLAVFHPDWEQVVASNEFSQWKTTVLSPVDSEELDNTWDAKYIASKLTEYKKWNAERHKKATTAVNRIVAAAQPKGNPRGGSDGYDDDSEEAAMLSAYQARR